MTASGATKVKLYAVHGVAGVLDLERADGSGLTEDQPVTGCANIEERALRKTGNDRRGRLPFARHVEVSEGLVTGKGGADRRPGAAGRP